MLEAQLQRAQKAERREATKKQRAKKKGKSVLFPVCGYMVCSSLMLITNKVAVHSLAAPSFVLWSQLFTTALFCWILGTLDILNVDALEWRKVRPFLLVAVVFLGTVFFNIKILQYCNVETFIVFRATTPVVVSMGDYFFLNRELPSRRSWLSLLGLVFGAYVYMATDAGFDVKGYTFVALWYAVFVLDQLWIKHVCNTVTMQSNWGRVYYTNFLSSLPLIVGVIYGQEIVNVKSITGYGLLALTVSCLLGMAMSYFAFLARHLLTAAAFTVVGNVCKILTVLINVAIWDKHANAYGMLSLLFCLLCAYQYKQAPERTVDSLTLSHIFGKPKRQTARHESTNLSHDV